MMWYKLVKPLLPTNQPTISSAISIKNIEFGDVAAGTLTVASGGSLTLSGSITGTWASSQTHTIAMGAQNLTVGGNLVLSDGTSGHAINLTVSTGTVTVSGSVTEDGGANITFSGAGNLNIGTDFSYTSGTFTPSTSTVTFNGVNSQDIGGVTYNNLVVNKSAGNATIASATTVNSNVTITAGELDINAATTIGGNLTVSTGTTFSCNASTVTISGNLSNSGTFIPGNGTITFNGTGSQTVSLATFNNLVLNNSSGGTTFTGNIDIYGDLTIAAGNIDFGTYTVNRTSQGGTFTLATGANLTVGSANNFPANYSTYNVDNASTVTYNGTMAQTVYGATYGNLTFTNGGSNAKTLTGTCIVNGDLLINSGATVDASAYTISLGGNWTNSGTFTPSTGAVLLNGTSKTITGTTTFNKVTVYGSYTVAGSNITYNTWLNVTTGASYAAGSGTAVVNGDLTNSGTLTSTGTTTFSGTQVQTIRLLNAISSTSTGVINFNGTIPPVLNSTSTPTFANLNINNTGGISPIVGWTVLVSMTIGAGATFNGGGSNHTIAGSFTNNGTFTSDATVTFSPPSAKTIAFGSNFSSTGLIKFAGAGATTITGTPTSLNDVTITNTNASGITPVGNWTLTGNFYLGSASVFNAGSYTYTVSGNVETNGNLCGGTSTFIMNGDSVTVAGSNSSNFYNFTIASPGFVTATADINVNGTFTNNSLFDASIGTLNLTGSTAGSITGSASPYIIQQLSNIKTGSATTTLGVNLTGITEMDIMSGIFDQSTYTLTEDAAGGLFAVSDNAEMKIGGTNGFPTFTTVTLDTFSIINYSGTTQAITNAYTYGSIKVSGSGTKTPAGALTMLSNFTLSAGTFAAGAYTHSVGGNWSMTGGTFTNTGSTILINGVAAQTIGSTGTFNNITINNTNGGVALTSAVTVNGALTLTSGKVTTDATNILNMIAGSTATSGSATSFINGPMTKAGTTAFVFPVGKNARWSRVGIGAPSSSTTFKAEYFDAHFSNYNSMATSPAPVLKKVSLKEYWQLDRSVGTGNTAVTLYWEDADYSGITDCGGTDLRIAHWNGSAWENNNDVVSTTGGCGGVYAGSITTSAVVTNFSPFTFGSKTYGPNPLPVELISFNAACNGSAVNINWATATEKDNKFFTLEKSIDEVNYTTVATIDGSGNTATVSNYVYNDEAVTAAITYYRLKQTDFSDQSKYSDVVAVKNCNDTKAGEVAIYPNPSNGVFTLKSTISNQTINQIEVYNVLGEKVYTANSNTTQHDLSTETPGVYFVHYMNNGVPQMKKMVIEK